jgi:hypothetical protein
MAAPNLKSPETITSVNAKTQPYSCTTTLAAALSNSANSNQVLLVSTITAANVDGVDPFNVDVALRRGGVDTYMAKASPVKAGETLVVRSREEVLNVEEGDAIVARASGAGKIDLLITYNRIS